METIAQPANFGRRLGAGIIDFVLTGVVIFALGKVCSLSKDAALLLTLPLALFGFAYSFVAHARFGRTLGKFLRIQVVGLDGLRVGWMKSLRRSTIDGILGLVWAAGIFTAVQQLPAESFQGQGWASLYKQLVPLFPAYIATVLFWSGLWPWSEFATMVLNKQRRAIHDFIGSTRVIQRDA